MIYHRIFFYMQRNTIIAVPSHYEYLFHLVTITSKFVIFQGTQQGSANSWFCAIVILAALYYGNARLPPLLATVHSINFILLSLIFIHLPQPLLQVTINKKNKPYTCIHHSIIYGIGNAW